MGEKSFAGFCAFFLMCATSLSPVFAESQVAPAQQNQVLTKEEVRDKGADAKLIELTTQKGEAPKKSLPASMKKKTNAPVIAIKGAAAFDAYIGNQSNKDTLFFDTATGNNVTSAKTRGASNMFGFDDTKLEFEIRQRVDFLWFLQWKINFAFSADKSVATPNFIKQAYITLNSKYSTIELGNYAGMEDRMAFSSVSILGGTGGFDGNSSKFVGTTTGTHTTVDLVGDTNEATKFNLLSSRWNGFMVGISYTPSTAHLGGAPLSTYGSPTFGSAVGKPYSIYNVAGGLNYVGFLAPDLKLSMSLTGVTGKSKPEVGNPVQSLDRHRIGSYAVGASLTWRNLSFAGEFADCGKSGQFTENRLQVNPLGVSGKLPPLDYTASQARAPQFFDVGLAYIYNQTKFAVGYLQSWRNTGFTNIKATAKVWNASITQQVSTGLSVYLEGFYYNTKNDAAEYESKMLAQSLPASKGPVPCITNQKAQVVILGLKASF